MGKLSDYSQVVKEILNGHAVQPNEQIEPVLIFDDEHHSYQLMYIGWENRRRTYASIIHIRLRNSKVYIEYDGTSEGIATALLDAGVPKEDIVLAFYSPAKRKLTEFAVT